MSFLSYNQYLTNKKCCRNPSCLCPNNIITITGPTGPISPILTGPTGPPGESYFTTTPWTFSQTSNLSNPIYYDGNVNYKFATIPNTNTNLTSITLNANYLSQGYWQYDLSQFTNNAILAINCNEFIPNGSYMIYITNTTNVNGTITLSSNQTIFVQQTGSYTLSTNQEAIIYIYYLSTPNTNILRFYYECVIFTRQT